MSLASILVYSVSFITAVPDGDFQWTMFFKYVKSSYWYLTDCDIYLKCLRILSIAFNKICHGKCIWNRILTWWFIFDFSSDVEHRNTVKPFGVLWILRTWYGAQMCCCNLKWNLFFSALAIYINEPKFLKVLHTAMESKHSVICSTAVNFLSHLLHYQMIFQHIGVSIFRIHIYLLIQVWIINSFS